MPDPQPEPDNVIPIGRPLTGHVPNRPPEPERSDPETAARWFAHLRDQLDRIRRNAGR